MGDAVTKQDVRIMNRIQEHLDFYHDHYSNEWVGIFLQGSQNYGLDTELSDIDTKIIVLPSFEDVILNRKPISHTLVLPNNEHCDVKDIRLMFDCFRKQNINFLEILFTRWKIMNPEYDDLFYSVLHNREMIASYSPRCAFDCMNGMIVQKHKSMFKPTPATQKVIDQYGYNGKDLCHMIRIVAFMLDRINGVSFEGALMMRGTLRNEALLAKNHLYALGEATEMAHAIDRQAKFLHSCFIANDLAAPNRQVDNLFESVLKNIFIYSFRKELDSCSITVPSIANAAAEKA